MVPWVGPINNLFWCYITVMCWKWADLWCHCDFVFHFFSWWVWRDECLWSVDDTPQQSPVSHTDQRQ